MPSRFSSPSALARFETQTAATPEQSKGADIDPRPPVLLTIRQCAKRLGISERSLHRRIADGTVRVIRLGRLVRIHPSELARLYGEPADDPKCM